jgi:hypothetical protein
MSGLNKEAMECCRNIHDAFLNRHKLDSWEVVITAMKVPNGLAYNETPHFELKLHLVNGKEDFVMRAEVEDDLKDTLKAKLDEFLEADYAAGKSLN